jgi:hypothetical protein
MTKEKLMLNQSEYTTWLSGKLPLHNQGKSMHGNLSPNCDLTGDRPVYGLEIVFPFLFGCIHCTGDPL